MLDRDRVTANLPGWPRSAAMRAALAIKIRQALKILLVQQHEPRLFVREHILPELSGERRQPLRDRSQSRLGVRRRTSAGADEIEVIATEHAGLFGRKPELVLFRLKRVDPLEQRLVQIGVAAMAGELGRDFALDRLQFFIGRGTRQIEKNGGDPIEAAAAALEHLDRIGEGRRRRIGGDGVDFAPRFFQRGSERGAEWRARCARTAAPRMARSRVREAGLRRSASGS